MIDSLLAFKDIADGSPILKQLRLCDGAGQNGRASSHRPYPLLTLHRPANVDDQDAFRNILEGLSEVRQRFPIIFPVHPRTQKRIEQFGFDQYFQTDRGTDQRGIRLIAPLGYLDFLCMMKNARLMLTDSGGIQEETTCLGIPCVTIRENTERPITIKHGTNVLAGTSAAGVRKAVVRQISRKVKARIPEKWDGKAAARIVPILVRAIRKVKSASVTCVEAQAAPGKPD